MPSRSESSTFRTCPKIVNYAMERNGRFLLEYLSLRPKRSEGSNKHEKWNTFRLVAYTLNQNCGIFQLILPNMHVCLFKMPKL